MTANEQLTKIQKELVDKGGGWLGTEYVYVSDMNEAFQQIQSLFSLYIHKDKVREALDFARLNAEWSEECVKMICKRLKL